MTPATKVSTSTTIIIVAIVIAIAAGLGIGWYFLGKRSKKVGSIAYDWIKPATVPAFKYKPDIKENSSLSTYTLMLAFNIKRFQPSAFPKILLSWGPLVIMLEKDTNDVFIAFRLGGTQADDFAGTQALLASAQGSSSSGPGPGCPTTTTEETEETPATTPDEDRAITAFNLLNSDYCLFHVPDCPFYKVSTMHLVYNYNRRAVRVYIDGALVKVCNLLLCSTHIGSVDRTKEVYAQPSLALKTSTATPTKSTVVFVEGIKDANSSFDVLSVGISSSEKSSAEIAKDSSSVIQRLTK
jgi:hypothetical protein